MRSILALVVVGMLVGFAGAGKVTVETGDNVANLVAERVKSLLSTLTTSADITVVCGDTPTSRSLIPRTELEALGSEGYIVRSSGNGVFAADGNAIVGGLIGEGGCC